MLGMPERYRISLHQHPYALATTSLRSRTEGSSGCCSCCSGVERTDAEEHLIATRASPKMQISLSPEFSKGNLPFNKCILRCNVLVQIRAVPLLCRLLLLLSRVGKLAGQ